MGSLLTEISNTSHYNSQSDTSGNNLPSESIIVVVKLVDYDETLDNDHINSSSNNTFINSMHTANVNNTIVLNNFSESLDLRWKACGKIAVFFNFVQNLKHTHFYAKFIVDSISENRFNVSCL